MTKRDLVLDNFFASKESLFEGLKLQSYELLFFGGHCNILNRFFKNRDTEMLFSVSLL